MKQPELHITRIEGKGKIIYEHISDEISFEIIISPFKIRLKTSKVTLGQLYAINQGKFEGVTNDGRIIHCDSISLVEYDKYRLTFVLLDKIVVGICSNPKIFEAPLFGLSRDILDFNYLGKSIKFTKTDDYESIKTARTNFGCHLPDGNITIENLNNENLDIIETIEMAKQICLILSFLLAKNISYNKGQFSDNINETITFYKMELIDSSTGTRYVYEKRLNDYLPKLMVNYSKLDLDEQKCIQTTVTYLNSTSNKYFEDQILAIAQIWEILADTFLSLKVENNQSINELRDTLKINIRSWHKSNEIKNYDLGFIMDRVLGSLDWEKAIRKMELLVVQEKIDSNLIGLNFKRLIEIRNQIAHSGRFKEKGKEYEYLDLFNSSLIGIHILILKRLGYSGTLTEVVGGIPKIKRIDNLVKK